jgi:hypothetical protein
MASVFSQLPQWAQQGAQVIDPSNNPYFGTFGGPFMPEAGQQSLGSGTGAEYAPWLSAMRPGEQVMEARTPSNQFATWLQDAAGNVRNLESGVWNDRAFGNAAALAALVTGANIAGPGFFGGGAAPGGAPAVVPGAAAPGAAAPTIAGGTGLAAPGATAGLGGAGAGMVPTAANTAAFTSGLSPALQAGLATPGLAAPAAAAGFGQYAPALTSLASGLYGMSQADKAARRSDPFAPFRGAYAERLMELEENPSLITSRPGWRAGLEAIDRGMASRGYTGSGNQAAALMRYGGEFYNREADRLAGLAGATQTPGAGQFQAADLRGQSLASIGYGLARFPWGG